MGDVVVDGWTLYEDAGEPWLWKPIRAVCLPEDLDLPPLRRGNVGVHVPNEPCSPAAQKVLREALERYQAKAAATPPVPGASEGDGG